MIYVLSKLLVKVPMILMLIILIYELATMWRGRGESLAKSFVKAALSGFAAVILLQAIGTGILAFITGMVSSEVGTFVDVMLGENIYNILIYLVFIGWKLYAGRKTRQRFVYISLISCFFAVGQIIFYYYLFLSNPTGLNDKVIGIATICSLVVLFVHGAMLELMERIVENQKRQNVEEKKLLEKKYQYDYYLLAEEQKLAVEKINEDMKKQLQAVQNLMESEEEEKKQEAEKILGELEEEINHLGRVYYCDDAVLNTILSLKQEKARKLGIEMEIQVKSILKTVAEDTDLCSILTNLLDNAIEATEKISDSFENEAEENKKIEKKILVLVAQRGGYLMLQVENPIVQATKKNKKGRYISSKKEGNRTKEHGRGLRIVETNVEKYGGYLDFKETEEKVIVTAFIKGQEE